MYYEEKVIDGKLMCRYPYTDDWTEVDYERLLGRYEQLKERNQQKRIEIEELEELTEKLEQLAMDARNHKLFR